MTFDIILTIISSLFKNRYTKNEKMRKIFTTITAFMMVLFSGAMLTACDEEPILYTITYNQSEDYIVTLSKTETQAGESVEVIIDTEYAIVSVYTDGNACEKVEENKYSFTMPAEDVNLSIELENTPLDITKGNIYIKDLWLEDMTGERVTVDNFRPSYITETFTLPSMILDQEYYTINIEAINLTKSNYLIELTCNDINAEAYMLVVALSSEQGLEELTLGSKGEILIAELYSFATNIDLSSLTITFISI